MKAVAYIRVSTDEQVRNGQGLDIQENEIKEYCKKNKIELVKIFEDAGISGAKEDRDGINKLLEYVKDKGNGIDVVITQKLDRLSRDTMFGLFIRKELKKADVELISVKEENISGNDPIQNLMQTIVFAFAEFEKEQIARRMLSGRREKAKEKKEKASGNCPIGYKYQYNEQGKNPVVVVDENTAPIVKRIFSEYLRGYSLQKIADRLNAEGITTQRGNKWSKIAVHRILKNDFYLGVVRFDDIEQQGNHTPLVSKVVFGKVKSLLSKNQRNAS